MKLCKICSNTIDEIRLEIIPDATTCASCINKKVFIPQQATEYTTAPITQFDIIAAENTKVRQSINENSFYLKPQKAKKKAAPQLPGLSKGNKKKGKNAKVNVVPFTFQGTDKIYKYGLNKFCEEYNVNKDDAKAAVAAGYKFHFINGCLWLDKGYTKVRIGSVANRKEKQS
jgi:hypothetical protein